MDPANGEDTAWRNSLLTHNSTLLAQPKMTTCKGSSMHVDDEVDLLLPVVEHVGWERGVRISPVAGNVAAGDVRSFTAPGIS